MQIQLIVPQSAKCFIANWLSTTLSQKSIHPGLGCATSARLPNMRPMTGKSIAFCPCTSTLAIGRLNLMPQPGLEPTVRIDISPSRAHTLGVCSRSWCVWRHNFDSFPSCFYRSIISKEYMCKEYAKSWWVMHQDFDNLHSHIEASEIRISQELRDKAQVQAQEAVTTDEGYWEQS